MAEGDYHPTILIIDDEEMVTTSLRNLFRLRSDYRIITHTSPVEALADESLEMDDTAADQQVRIIDVESAKRVKKRAHSFRPYQAPYLPLRIVGLGMKKGLVAVDREHLLDRTQYYMSEHERGFVPVVGHLGCRAASPLSAASPQSILWQPCPAVGTGMTIGIKYYRRNFLRPGGQLDVSVRVSSMLYQEYGMALSLPIDGRQTVFWDMGGYYRVRTQEDFFGLGNESRVADRTSYMLKTSEAFAGPRFELARGVRLSTQFGFRATSALDGKDTRFPPITRRFSPDKVPGLRDGARMWVAGTELLYDDRDMPKRPRKGGYHRLSASWHQSANSKDFGFWRYEVEAERYVPLWSRNRILALRFSGTTIQTRGGSTVPFFDQAILGGSGTMRAFREFRFYDLSGILMTAEYRYNLNAFMDIVIFVDEGQVAREPGDFSRRGQMTLADVDAVLKRAARTSDGRYRAFVSLGLPGKGKGGFKFYGTRKDDPNDLIPHEHRRELRGLRLMCAWVNHWDVRTGNNLDMYVDEGGRKFLRHYLQDVGSTLGAASNAPEVPRMGFSYIIDPKQMAGPFFSLGLYQPLWREHPAPIGYSSVGRFESTVFSPASWKPGYPVVSFLYMDGADAFWAAKIVMSFSEEQIRAAVKAGQFSDPKAEDFVVRTLIERQRKIGQYGFSLVNPLDKFTGSRERIIRSN